MVRGQRRRLSAALVLIPPARWKLSVGVVDQDLHRPELGLGAGDHDLDALRVGDAALYGDGLGTALADVIGVGVGVGRIIVWVEAVPALFPQQLGWLRPRRSACAVGAVSGGTAERAAAMMRSTFTIISAGSPCTRSPAVLVRLRGFPASYISSASS